MVGRNGWRGWLEGMVGGMVGGDGWSGWLEWMVGGMVGGDGWVYTVCTSSFG